MDKEQNKKTPAFSHGPKEKREARLLWLLKIAMAAIVLQTVMFGAIVAALTIKPERVVVIDKTNGEVIGEYQTTAMRTNAELIAGGKRFAQYHLSFNSASVYDDFAMALNMMSDKLRQQRIVYLKESNLARDIKSANSTSHLEFNTEKIIELKGSFAKVEFAGDLVIGDRSAIAVAAAADTVVVRKLVPFRIVVDLQMVPISTINTAGVKVVDYYEYK